MNLPSVHAFGGALCFALAASHPLSAQSVGSLVAERARLFEITGDSLQLPRAPKLPAVGTRLPVHAPHGKRVPLSIVHPEVRITWNSTIPYSMNDGALWAGRGWNVGVGGGIAFQQLYRGATARVVVAPSVLYSQNRNFQVFQNTTPGRSGFANPFHGPDASLDLPHRFGDRHLLTFDAGRSSLAVEWPKVAVGITGENEWWGPGIRNAIVMSNNAPGVPRLFLKTSHPIRTPLGQLEAKLTSGTLTQSLFFSNTSSEHRTLSGVLLQLRPAFDSTITFGFARVVYALLDREASPFQHTLTRSFDALLRWESLDVNQRSDQIGAVFARWVFPDAGFEFYGEWARMALPRSATELLTAAHHTGGWTFGFQWAQPRRKHSWLRLQSELTYLEQSRVFPDRPMPDFYSGMASPQGYTQRGQIIGAAIGPGASSQFIAVDWVAPRWQLGAFLGRVRWDNDAMYRRPAPTFWHHDVSVLAGLRGGWRAPLSDFMADLSFAKRYNYLFQNGIARPGGYRTVDVNNITLALVATPR